MKRSEYKHYRSGEWTSHGFVPYEPRKMQVPGAGLLPELLLLVIIVAALVVVLDKTGLPMPTLDTLVYVMKQASATIVNVVK